MTSGWDDDDALLGDLRDALAEADETPPVVTRLGLGLYSWLTVDKELAELVDDSADHRTASVRAGESSRRSLSFRSTQLTIEADLEPARRLLRGQVVARTGPQPEELEVESIEGDPIRVPVDEVGYFVADLSATRGRFRLVCGSTVTPFVTLD
jgi:hypothetical protein